MTSKIKDFLSFPTKALPLIIFALLLCASLFPMHISAAEQTQTDKNKLQTAQKAEIAPFGKTLFYVYGDLGAATADIRAQIINSNISELKNAVAFDPALLRVIDSEETSNVVYMNKPVVGITQQQEDITGKPKRAIAEEYMKIISDSVQQERSQNEFIVLLKQAGLILLAAFLVFVCIKIINRIHDYAKVKLARRKDAKGDTLLELDKHIGPLFTVLKIIRILLILFIVYICFLALLWFFPETHALAYKLLDSIKRPLVNAFLSVWHYLPNLLEIAVIIFMFYIFSKIFNTFFARVASGKIKLNKFHPDWAAPTNQIIRVILIIFAFIFIFPLLPKSNSGVFKGISVFLGVLFSLGSTSIINNIVSGFVITYMRPFNIGDRIKMGEHFGNVIEKNALVTRVRTPKNEIITIPNSAIMTATTTNYTNSAESFGLILHTNVTIGYNTQWRKVHEMLIEAALKTPDIIQEPKPFVYQHALSDSYVDYQLNAYTKNADKMHHIYSELHQNIQDVFARENVEIMSPHYLATREGNKTTIPEKTVNN